MKRTEFNNNFNSEKPTKKTIVYLDKRRVYENNELDDAINCMRRRFEEEMTSKNAMDITQFDLNVITLNTNVRYGLFYITLTAIYKVEE